VTGVKPWVVVIGLSVLGTAVGCSGQPNEVRKSTDDFAKEKVDLMRRLADEVAKNPASVNVAGLAEEFMNLPLDPQKNPSEAAEILRIYKERVQGKLRGEVAITVQSAVRSVQTPPAGSK
jgi:hypothetical protein